MQTLLKSAISQVEIELHAKKVWYVLFICEPTSCETTADM